MHALRHIAYVCHAYFVHLAAIEYVAPLSAQDAQPIRLPAFNLAGSGDVRFFQRSTSTIFPGIDVSVGTFSRRVADSLPLIVRPQLLSVNGRDAHMFGYTLERRTRRQMEELETRQGVPHGGRRLALTSPTDSVSEEAVGSVSSESSSSKNKTVSKGSKKTPANSRRVTRSTSRTAKKRASDVVESEQHQEEDSTTADDGGAKTSRISDLLAVTLTRSEQMIGRWRHVLHAMATVSCGDLCV